MDEVTNKSFLKIVKLMEIHEEVYVVNWTDIGRWTINTWIIRLRDILRPQ